MADGTTKSEIKDSVAIAGLCLAFEDAHHATQAIFELIHELVGMPVCVVSRIDLAANTLTVVESFDRVGLGISPGMVLPANEMPCDYVVRSDAALRHTDLADHPVFRRMPICAALGIHAYVGVPLRRSDGSVWGTLAASDTRALETSDAHLRTLVVLARLVAFEFERQEQRDVLAAQAKELEDRLAMQVALEAERLRAVRLKTVLEAAATVSHEVNNPLTVLQLRLGRLTKRFATGDTETLDDLDVAQQAADEIHQVTVRLRRVVNPVSTQYLSGKGRMLDLAASMTDVDGAYAELFCKEEGSSPSLPSDAE